MTIYNLSSPPTIKMLSLWRRYCGSNVLSRIKLTQAREMAMKSAVVYLLLTEFGANCQNLDFMTLVLIGCCTNYMSLMTSHPHLNMKLPKIVSKQRHRGHRKLYGKVRWFCVQGDLSIWFPKCREEFIYFYILCVLIGIIYLDFVWTSASLTYKLMRKQ